MRPESVKPQTKEETLIRKSFHALLKLQDLTMERGIFVAMGEYVEAHKDVFAKAAMLKNKGN